MSDDDDKKRHPYGVINGLVTFSPEYDKSTLSICWDTVDQIFNDNHAVGRMTYRQVHCENDQLCWHITVNYIIRDLTKESIHEILRKIIGILPPRKYSFQISDYSGSPLILSNIGVK